jgi:hypothetical protein
MSELAGKRALVTGASSGIGAELAKLLAAEGVELVLTARRPPALDAVAAACRDAGATVHVLRCDLGRPDAAAELWALATAGGPIEIAINNAGFGYYRPFGTVDAARDAELLQLNVTSLVEISRAFVAARAGQPERAYLLNIASIAAYQAVPNFAVYAASKAFVRNFTEALHDELAGSPISATCVCPGGTRTEFHAAAGAGDYGWVANRSMMSAEAVARFALTAMRRGRRTAIPGLVNQLACWGVRLVPRRVASWIAGRVLGPPRDAALPARGQASPPAAAE